MSSSAARREQIQLELQLLRERQARERDAFDAVAAAHPELSAAEVTALALRKAEEAVPQAIDVDGAVVRVGDRVTVKDDLSLLRRADRGYFAPDLLKPIYLGERGAVVRVMASFQGKPAVELKFADGVTKVFFTECLQVDAAEAATGAAAAGGGAAPSSAPGRRADISEVPVFVPPTKAALPPPKAESMPGWGQLSMPHRRPAERASGAAAASASPPPPPPTVSALRTRGTSQAPSVPTTRTPSRSPSSPAPAAAPAAVAEDDASAKEASPPHPASSGAPPVTIMKESPVKRAKAAPASSLSSSGIPIIKHPSASRASSPPHHSVATRASAAAPSPLSPEEVGSSGEGSPVVQRAVKEEECAAAALASTPEAPLADSHLVTAEDTLGGSHSHHVPEAGAVTYKAKYELQDDASRIPRRQSLAGAGGSSGTPTSGTRVCWVCGLPREDAPLSEPARVAFSPQCTTMFSLFAVLTRKLQWDREQRTASRLFTEKGAELKTAGAVRDGMRLVATAGCAYRPDAHIDAFRTVPEGRPQAPSPKSRAADTAKLSETSAAAAAATPASPPAPKATLVMQRRSSATTTTANAAAPSSPAQLHRNPVAPPAAARKPRHIRVYENGLYDDNVYRTVTVRSTYKSLVALKATITRELQWRDGKRVDLLFDACGAEITDLDAIDDGDVVVASAGDRFAVPYPNTPMHQEAMKLAERLNPARKC